MRWPTWVQEQQQPFGKSNISLLGVGTPARKSGDASPPLQKQRLNANPWESDGTLPLSGSVKAQGLFFFFSQPSQLTEANQIIPSFGWVPVQQTPPRRVVLENKSHSYAIGCASSPLFLFFSCIIYSSAVPFFPEWLTSLPWIQSMLPLIGLDRSCGGRHVSTGQTGGVPKTPWLQSILGAFVKHNYSESSGWLFQHQSADLPSLKSGTTASPAWKCNSVRTTAGFVHKKKAKKKIKHKGKIIKSVNRFSWRRTQNREEC